MAGQSDSAEDLINELSRLMAQDASGNRSETAPATEPGFAVRIPGEPKSQPTQAAAPRPVAPVPAANAPTAPPPSSIDFLRSIPTLDAERRSSAPVAPAVSAETSARPEPQFARPEPQVDRRASAPAETETFNFDFDFDLGGKSGAAEQPAFPASPVPPAPKPAAPVAETTVSAPAAPPVDEHDSIADLIAADLAGDAPPAAPAPRVDAMSSRSEPEFAPQPEAPSARPEMQQPQEARVPPRLDNDRFKVPPVFGLGSSAAQSAQPAPGVSPQPGPPKLPPRPVMPVAEAPAQAHKPTPIEPIVTPPAAPPPQDSASLDPIDEIESLIGRAMRVDLSPAASAPVEAAPEVSLQPVPAPGPTPALRSLAGTDAPQPEKRRAMSAADEAIFAAAQATGAQIGWVDEPELPPTETAAEEIAPRHRRRFGITRAVAGPLVAIALLLVAGLGLYWVLGLGGREAGPAPLLTADTTPTKQDAPVETTTPQQSVVFNEIDGVAPGAEEQLVSRDQTVTDDAVQTAAAIPAQSEEGLANRKVRTVTVRPDGTIVSSDQGVAGSSILPVDRPNVPEVPGATDAVTELLAATETALATPNATPEATTPATPAPEATATPVVPGSTVPAVDLTGNAIAGKTAVIPLQRPNGLTLPAASAASAQTLAPTTEAATTTPTAAPAAAVEQPVAASTPAGTAPAYVQLASQRTEQDALNSANAMVRRFGPLFGGANLEVQRVDLGAKGIYYRVRVPAASAEQAAMICTNVKAAGGDCFTM